MSEHPDLRAIVEAEGPFLTVAIPTPSRLDDAQHRFETHWKNARASIGDDWPDGDLDDVEAVVLSLPHGRGEALVVVHARGGPTMAEFLDEPIVEVRVDVGELPRLGTLIDARQRAIPHVVVETDRAGADLTAFDGGSVLATETVEGDTEHIHRGHPGGWSQRRFQQRAENTWEDNARAVAEAVTEMAADVDAELIAVAGEVRARSLLVDELAGGTVDVLDVEAGDPDGISEAVVTALADRTARRITELADDLRSRMSADTAVTGADATLGALAEGRVDTLVVHDDVDADDETRQRVDRAIADALRSDATIVVAPRLAVLDDGMGALLRW